PPEPSPSRQSAAPELFVIRLQHAKASEVAATVNALYGRVSAFGEIGERQGTLSQQLQQQQVQSGVGAAPQIVPTVAGRNATLAGETTIVPDSRANSLIIRASRSDFDLIQAAVSQLDVRPLQVLIEVLIAEVNRNRSTDIGVEATMPTTQIKGSDSVSIAGAISSGGGLGGLALQVMGVSKLNIDATIRAVASRGNVHILNRPVLLAANNERAEINVGSQRPFVQIARVLATDNTARDQVVQYKDVGTRLSIIPTISSSGYVMLQIVQEVNAATAEQQFDAPVISTRSLETRLLVKDSQTIVLGGLTDTQHETVRVGVPILSSIPWLGALFGHQTSVSNETELLLFLTPRIIHDDAEADDVTGPRLKRADKIKP
ncbi:MAG TPA: secretin N-terminal domain-containing protein, partial [Gemmatimonadaceae bacterium]